MAKITDTEMIDFLEKQNTKRRYTGRCIFRLSSTSRGWRLYETSLLSGKATVREAIADAIKKEGEEK